MKVIDKRLLHDTTGIFGLCTVDNLTAYYELNKILRESITVVQQAQVTTPVLTSLRR
jgi:hypothetical protein